MDDIADWGWASEYPANVGHHNLLSYFTIIVPTGTTVPGRYYGDCSAIQSVANLIV